MARRWATVVSVLRSSPGPSPRRYLRTGHDHRSVAPRCIGRPYVPLWRWPAEIPARPPFKPCVRISRTRLTGGLSRDCITPPPGTGGPAQTVPPEGVEECSARAVAYDGYCRPLEDAPWRDCSARAGAARAGPRPALTR